MKTQTLFLDMKGNIILRIDDILYTPIGTIVIEGRSWQGWSITDEFEDWIVRKITLVW